jgi:hypothetical protein
LNRLVDLDEILYGGDEIKMTSVPSNPVHSTIPKWRTFKLLRWVQRNLFITFELISGFKLNFVWG